MYRESLAAYQEVIELAPSDAEAYLGIGLTYWNMDEKDLAISSWQKSLLIKPENNESQGWLILYKARILNFQAILFCNGKVYSVFYPYF